MHGTTGSGFDHEDHMLLVLLRLQKVRPKIKYTAYMHMRFPVAYQNSVLTSMILLPIT